MVVDVVVLVLVVIGMVVIVEVVSDKCNYIEA